MILNVGERHSIVDVVPDVLLGSEPRATLLDAVLSQVDEDQIVAKILQILRPPTMARSDLEDRRRGHKSVYAWKDGSPPLRFSSSPGPGPLVLGALPACGSIPRRGVLVDPHGPRIVSAVCSSLG